jgi:hypothetical protein
MSEAIPEYKPVKVYTSSIDSDILIVKMALERGGIPYELSNENLATFFPGLDGISHVDVLVNECNEQRARKIIADQFKQA